MFDDCAMSASDDDFDFRFSGTARLYGREGLKALRGAHVAVVGIGGVGSWVVEALARSGVGKLSLVDLDDVCASNVNRQVHALNGTIGKTKVAVMEERARAIQPTCDVVARHEFFNRKSAAEFFEAGAYSVVVDAIDSLSSKCLLIAECRKRGVPVVTTGGAGGRRDPLAVEWCDLSRTRDDSLAKMVRKKLRQDFGFTRLSRQKFGVPCVYSKEPPIFPWADGSVCATREAGSELGLDCDSGFGTAAHVTGAFGLAAASLAIRIITEGAEAVGIKQAEWLKGITLPE